MKQKRLQKRKATTKKLQKRTYKNQEVKASELLENDDKLKELKTTFQNLPSKGNFRVGSKNELLNINELIVKSHYDSLISKVIRRK